MGTGLGSPASPPETQGGHEQRPSLAPPPPEDDLVCVEQLLAAAQRAAQVSAGPGEPPAAQPGHLLLQVSVELEQELPGLQGLPAALQLLTKVLVPT